MNFLEVCKIMNVNGGYMRTSNMIYDGVGFCVDSKLRICDMIACEEGLFFGETCDHLVDLDAFSYFLQDDWEHITEDGVFRTEPFHMVELK